jgi:hypothetical protein
MRSDEPSDVVDARIAQHVGEAFAFGAVGRGLGLISGMGNHARLTAPLTPLFHAPVANSDDGEAT